jgi:hypothetical protein
MKSYVETEITITPAQLARVMADIEKEMRAEVWAGGWGSLSGVFDDAFDDALTNTLGIEWGGNVVVPDFDRTRLIVGSEEETMELEKVQQAIWERVVVEGCSIDTLHELVDKLVTASFAYLGIKIKAARSATRAKVTATWRPVSGAEHAA